ncbi:MAG: Type 1 glutamine amidotransferase-like domain-containing protein [Pseudomonadota bacterium]
MKLLLTSTVQYFAPKLPEVLGEDLSSKNVLYIPTAAYAEDGYEEWLVPELNAIKPLVKNMSEFDIQGKSHEELVSALEGIDILYVTGGNTYVLLEAMNNIDFKKALLTFLESGGVYLGSSAGSIVMCPDINFIREMDEPKKARLETTKGLGLIDFAIMPHINQPKFNDIFVKTLEGSNKDKTIIGLRDDQALWVENNYIQTC